MSLFDALRRRHASPPAPPAARGAKLADGRVAIVTGGAGLVGSAICRSLALEGAAVAVAYHRSEAQANALAAELQHAGARAGAWRADIREEAQVAALVAAVCEALGPVDVLVNNAAPSQAGLGARGFLHQPWADYQAFVDTVLKGAMLCTRAVLPSMVERRFGRIVNIGTTAVDTVSARVNPYVTAKAGLRGFTRSLAEEFGAYGITVNQVVPGRLWTEARPPAGHEGEPFRSRSPLHPGLATPADVADAVTFLASDRARMITGAYLPVAAGLIMP
jgi:3-oxoacyl-[acyl-carrier protein] reductase